MIFIPPLRTKRFTVNLRELTLGQSIALLSIPPEKAQAECSKFLSFAIEKVEGAVQNPEFWTVEERTFAVCQYLAVTNPKEPDFPIGEGHFSDYLDGSADFSLPKAPVFLGEQKVLGDAENDSDRWYIRPFIGKYANAVERLQGTIKDASNEALRPRLHWILGAMASMLVLEAKQGNPPNEPPDTATDSEIDEFLVKRMSAFSRYPTSEFVRLFALFYQGREKLFHLFKMDFSDQGIVFLPINEQKEADGTLPPARFPVRSAIPSFAQSMAKTF